MPKRPVDQSRDECWNAIMRGHPDREEMTRFFVRNIMEPIEKANADFRKRWPDAVDGD